MKDWVGNGNSVFKTLGASNHAKAMREQDDFYATSRNMKIYACHMKYGSRRVEPDVSPNALLSMALRFFLRILLTEVSERVA